MGKIYTNYDNPLPNVTVYGKKNVLPEVTVYPNDVQEQLDELKRIKDPWALPTLEEFVAANLAKLSNGKIRHLPKKINPMYQMLDIPRYDNGKYVVRKGDSPCRIAHNHGMSLQEFYNLNPWTEGGVIHPDDVVKIKEKEKVYIPRMSEELLRGVTVTAKRLRSPKKDKVVQTHKEEADSTKRTLRPKVNTTEQDTSNINNEVKQAMRNAAYQTRSAALNVAEDVLPESDFKEDVVGILKAPTINDTFQMVDAGFKQRGAQAWEKLKSLFDNNSDLPQQFYDRSSQIPEGKYDLFDLPVREGSKLTLRDIDNSQPISNVVSDTTALYRRPDPNRFKANTVTNMNTTRVGFRNRYRSYDSQGHGYGGYNDDPVENTEGIVVASYNPFLRYGHPALSDSNVDYGYGKRPWNYYYGVDDAGHFVHGSDYEKLPKNGYYTRSIAHKITGLSNNVPGQSVLMHKTDGSTSAINLTGSTKAIDKVHRGGTLIAVGNDVVALTGSFDHMNNQIERMKRRHNVDAVTLIEEDNGSYSERWMTKNHKISKDDWRTWFNQNTSKANGNAMYILPNHTNK